MCTSGPYRGGRPIGIVAGTVDAIIVGALVVVEVFGARRALWGKPPARQWRFGAVGLVCACIHLGFHAAATAAPSLLSVASLVLAGWLTFTLWLAWLSRAPKPERGDGGEGGGGGGPSDDDDDGRGGGPGDGEPEFDWDAFEREFWPYVRDRERRERRGVTPPSPAGS
jgi:hypothetical protein